jgi:DHA1 family tetracycline resistance protein-like MFS transporter
VSRPLLVIFLTIFVNLIGFGIVIPLLPFYATEFGASPLVVGVLFASYSICQLVAAPVLGGLSDRWGRRPVLLFSILGTAVSFLVLAVAQSLPLLFASRMVDGLSGGNISTARAYISDVTEPRDRAKAFGLIGAAFGLGFICGPALAGLLSPVSFSAPAWAATGLALAAALLCWVWLPETVHRAASPSRGSIWTSVSPLLRRPRVGRLLAIDFLYWTTFALYQTTFALFGAQRFQFGPSEIGFTLAFTGVLGVAVHAALVGPVVRRFGERLALAGGLCLAGAALGAASITSSVPVFLAALVPAAVGFGISIPALTSLLSKAARGDEQGIVQGVAGSMESLGRTIGPVWGNGALQAFGSGSAYLSAAALMLLTGLYALGLGADSMVSRRSPP